MNQTDQKNIGMPIGEEIVIACNQSPGAVVIFPPHLKVVYILLVYSLNLIYVGMM